MRKIRKEQMSALRAASTREFYQKLLRFLRRELPSETQGMSNAELLGRIQDSDERAARYGITSAAGVSQFACLTFAAGPAFDESPDIHAYLSQRDVDPDEKMSALVDALAEADEDDGASAPEGAEPTC